jgi:uncharacterized protein YbcI
VCWTRDSAAFARWAHTSHQAGRADGLSVSFQPSPGPARWREAENGASMPGTPDGRPSAGSQQAAISREIVRLLHEYTGRGPTKARTHINNDLVTVVLEDTLTMGERSLVADGKTQHVLATRKAFQETMSVKMVAAVEEHSGRRVLAFLSSWSRSPATGPRRQARCRAPAHTSSGLSP